MNAYKVSDTEGVYVIVAASSRRQALALYPTDYAERSRLLERDINSSPGDITFEYLRSRGVDLIMSGVISPNWYNDIGDASYDDYRKWNGFTSAATWPEARMR